MRRGINGAARLSLILLCFMAAAARAGAQREPPRMVRTPDIHGDRIVFSVEGDLWLGSVQSGAVPRITTHEGTEENPRFSPDGKWIAFLSDRSGEENLWIAPASGQGEARPLTHEAKQHLYRPLWSPDSKRIAFHDEALGLWLIDIGTKQKTEVARSQYEPISDYRFSPDGKWLAYARPENQFVRSLYLYEIATKRATRLTFPPTRDSEPAFDPMGKYLYFLSDRNVAPQWDSFDFQLDFDKPSRIYLITLAAGTLPPQPVESDEEPGSLPRGQTAAKADDDKSDEAESDKSKPGESEKKKETSPPEKLPEMKFELDGITDTAWTVKGCGSGTRHCCRQSARARS